MERRVLIRVASTTLALFAWACLPPWPGGDLPAGADAGIDSPPEPACDTTGIVFVGYTVYSDDNDDGQANKGEAVSIDITLFNCDGTTRSGVSATLSTSDSTVTMVSGYRDHYYGDILRHKEKDSSYGSFRFNVSTGAAAHDASFVLAIQDGEGNLWQRDFRVPIVATGSTLAFKSYVVYSEDNGDGQANKGETVSIDITLANGGASKALGLTGTLSTADSAVTMLSGYREHYFGDIDGRGEKSSSYGSYRFSIASTATPHEIPFTLTVEDQDGNTWKSEFTLPVTGTGSQLGFKSYEIYSEDNDDGKANKGETIAIDLTLRNAGLSAALGVTATLSTSDAAVSLLSGYREHYFGDIGGGADKASSYGSYRFSVSTSAAPHGIAFALSMKDQDGNQWNSDFQVPLVATGAALGFKSFTVYSDGNSNGTANPGETVAIDITLRNSGSSNALGVNATLSTTDSAITILSGYRDHYFGDVGAGSDKSSSYGSFRFSVSSSATAHSVPFKVALADQDGNTWSASFQVPVQ